MAAIAHIQTAAASFGLANRLSAAIQRLQATAPVA